METKFTKGRLSEIQRETGIAVSEYWLNLLLGMNKHEVGVVKASGKLLEGEELAAIVRNYQTLDNKLGITLPLIIGGGPQYDELPSYRSSRKVNGIRVTYEQLLSEMVPVAQKNLENVVESLNCGGVEARAMPFGVLRIRPHGIEIDSKTGESIDTGYVGDVLYVDTAPIITSLHNSIIPVISHIGMDHDGQEYNVNATPAAAQVVKWLQAYKLMLLGDRAVEDNNGYTISEIKSEADLHQLITEGIIKDGMALNTQSAYELLKQIGPGRSVQITTPSDLLAELLTDGVGTIMRMPYIIQSYDQPEHLGENGKLELTDIFNSAFLERGLALVTDYWEESTLAEHPINRIYIEAQEWSGGMVVRQFDNMGYACKIATKPDYRGNGFATQAIERAVLDYGGLIWRTGLNENNPSIDFYDKAIHKFKNNGIANPGMVTDSFEANGYKVYVINAQRDKVDVLVGTAAKLPNTMQSV
ncbi:hypothetical protein GF323_04790 [Candidatus Woesearchaeota archaeon]|nr:hypothetical protein [Candidatus Woesearchaeota archaeon]